MRILMIGGTRFVGRHIVSAALAGGHEVTVFHRGRTGADLFPEIEHRLGDRDGDLAALRDGSWDATIDTCAYVPRQVESLADALGERGGQHAFVSSVSVYAPPAHPGYSESSPLLEAVDPAGETVTNETYGPLKVLCERAAVRRHGVDTLIVRPTYVVGPDDYTWRFPSWVTRISRGGEVLAPGPANDHAQVIDARDMAAWIVSMLERRHGGVFHPVGPSVDFTWGEELQAIVDAVGPPGTHLRWVDEHFLLEQGLDGSALPLWSGGDDGRLIMAADPSAVLAAGLHIRPLVDTIRDTLAWALEHEQPADANLDASRERALLTRWKDRS